MEKLAIFGGTFNPIHWGHLLIAEAAFEQFALDSVLWVPSRLPPHKLHLVKFEHRLEMVRLAIADRPHFTVSNIEAKRSGISWAIDTFHDLQVVYPNSQWFWIIGADAFENLAKWRGSQELSNQCVWLVAPRSGESEERGERSEEKLTQNSKLKTQNAQKVRSQWIQMSPIALSSSQIRQYCREGRLSQGATPQKSLDNLIPKPVRAYIESHNLY
ncbi:nicotinate (nicotinamide) nucleotide adenylyltransferase [Phormidesmis priestleyi]